MLCLGDGAALYSPQALWTAATEDLLVTFIVINNREYNVLKAFMRSQPHSLSAQTGRFIGMDITRPPIDFGALAAAMGLPARRISRADEVTDTVTEAIASCGPNLLEIVVDVE